MTAPEPAQATATAPEQQVTPAPPEAPPAPVVEDPPGSEHLGEPGKKALDAMKAQVAEYKAKVQEFEDRDKTAEQRAQAEAARATAELADLKRQNALLAAGIPVDLTPPEPTAAPEEWSAYASKLNAWRGAAVPPPAQQPQPDPGQGITQPPQSEADAQYAAFLAATSPNNR